ncbi:MAG: DegT/DnrJ/EryC1/StrS aminotransferase family protein [Bryobacteraceae bacterium]
MSAHNFIPFHVPSIGEEEIQEVVDTLRGGWLTTGERTHRFEKDFKSYIGCRNALAVNSCTAGLHLAAAALGIGPGDEVITTPLTFCATVNTILHVGATPVLADVGADGNIDPHSIAARITPRTKAIIPVHLAGLPCDMHSIWSLAKKHKLFVIEDAAHAAGTYYRGLPLGAAHGEFASDAVAWSFYATKNITTGEGGMVTTDNDALHARMKVLCLHGISKDAWNRYAENGSWYYEVLEPGFKYNLSDLQSALGIHQLRKVEQFAAARRSRAALYSRFFRDVEEVEIPTEGAANEHSWHLYVLRIRPEKLAISRNQFIEELKKRKIGTSVHFIPVPLHPFFAPWAREERNHCPRAMNIWERSISLPLFPDLRDEQVDTVASNVLEIIREHRAPVFALGQAGKAKYAAAAPVAD